MTNPRTILPLLGAAVLGIAALSWAGEPASAPRYRVSTKEAPRHLVANGKGTATMLLNASTGATAASLTLMELDKGTAFPEHVHETSAEILYIEDGAAEITVNGQKLRVERGDAVYIPAGMKHSGKVVSEGPLRALQIYAGPGPEQLLTEGPRVDKKGGN